MESLVNQYGHDDSLFLSETQDYLHCGICTLVLRDSVMIVSCGHKFCSVCFQRWRSSSETNSSDLRCPIDRDIVDLTKVHDDFAMRRVVGSLVVRCPEHESGCQWTGDLSDMNAHLELCRYKPVNLGNSTPSLSSVQLKEINDRLDRYEESLLGKDKENASLKQEQLQLKEEIRILKQQHEQQKQQKEQEQRQEHHQQQQKQQKQQQEITGVVENNTILKQKVLQLEKNQEAQQELQEKQYKQLEQQQSTINELLLKVEMLQKELTSRPRGEQIVDLAGGAVADDSVRNRSIPLQHRIGDPSDISISEDKKTVNFGDRGATVCAPTGVVPPYAKVWFEIECSRNKGGWNVIGWATNDLPTSFTYVDCWVGKCAHKYGYEPFLCRKWNTRSTTYGMELNGDKYIFGTALDLVRGEVLFSVDGQWTAPMGVAFSGISPDIKLFPAVTGKNSTICVNFGDQPFKYGPPDSTYKTLMH